MEIHSLKLRLLRRAQYQFQEKNCIRLNPLRRVRLSTSKHRRELPDYCLSLAKAKPPLICNCRRGCIYCFYIASNLLIRSMSHSAVFKKD